MPPLAVLFDPAWGPWPVAGLLALLGAALALDETAFAQTWFSQPLPAAILAGLVCGDPVTGLALGLPAQLVSLGNLPIGQTLVGERTSPVVAAVGAAALAGHRLPVLFQGGSGAEAGRLGWLLLAVVGVSLLGRWVIRAERQLHFRWMTAGLRSLRDGRLERLERAQRLCLAATALRGAAGALLWLGVFRLAWLPAFERLPTATKAALAVLPLLTGPLAVAALLELYGTRSGLRWLGIGLAAGAAAAWRLAT